MIQENRLLETFLQYIQIDSESRSEGAFAQRLAQDLEAIGCQVRFDSSMAATGSNTGNLYATLPGEGEPLMLCAHMDTVVPGKGVQPVITDGVIRSAGNTVLGGDDKSGVAAVVEAMRTVQEQGIPHCPVQAVFTVCEEAGLYGSKNADKELFLGNRVVVLDSSGAPGKIIMGAPGAYDFDLTIQGRRAHAGVAPEQGISAIQAASQAIANMKLLRIDEETTANIGTMESIFPTNIVPDSVHILAECRSRDAAKLEAQKDHMMDCFRSACEKYGAVLVGEPKLGYGSYQLTQEDELVQLAGKACEKAGLTPVYAFSGGGSDANIFSTMGCKAINLGTGMTKVHTTDEELSVADLTNTAKLVLALITL